MSMSLGIGLGITHVQNALRTLIPGLYTIGGDGLINLGTLTDARVADVNLPDPDGIYRAIPGGMPALVDPATGRTPRVVGTYPNLTYYATDSGGTNLPSYGKWELAHYPALTNGNTYSYDLTHWSQYGTSVSALDAVGLGGVANTATTLTDDDTGAYNSIANNITITADTNTHTACIIIDKDSDTGRFPELAVKALDGTMLQAGMQLNTSTGVDATRVPGSVYKVLDMGTRWKILISITNNGTNTILQVGVFPAITTTLGSAEVAATGSIIIPYIGIHFNKTIADVENQPPIPTSGAAASRDACALQYPYAGHFTQSAGTVILPWRPAYPQPGYNDGCLSTTTDANGLLHLTSTGLLASNDGTTVRTLDGIVTVDGVKHFIAIRYSAVANILQLGFREEFSPVWVWGDISPYDGLFTTDSNFLRLFYNNDNLNYLGAGFQVLNRDVGTAGVEVRSKLLPVGGFVGSYDLSDKGITAVDAFVYDTRRDSDGGAWRLAATTQSWYTETLNTATRGSRAEFPVVAVIVAESNKTTVYDGDDPTLPMWMVFNSGVNTSTTAGMVNNNASGIAAKDGKIATSGIYSGSADSWRHGLTLIDLISDEAIRMWNSSTVGWKKSGIANRNSGTGGVEFWTGQIADNTANDIAITTLADAPIDGTTGLPVPTIAVATTGGVSVIKDDGIVTDSASTSSILSISFVDNGRLLFSYGSEIHYVEPADYEAGDGFGGISSERYTTSTIPAAWNTATGLGVNLLAESAGGNSLGLLLFDEDTTTPADGMVAYITSTYNTGWMQGDIKLALSDSLTDRSVAATTVTDNGVAVIAPITPGTEQNKITASGGTITAPVTTGGAIYGWENVSGTWYFRANSSWVGVSESAGVLTIADGTTIAMLRYTNGTGPSAAQYAKIENDETLLFSANAACTIYGSSDAVVALDYDPATQKLEVGTSDGRSSFRGLQRISNNTSATTSAIAARNGLIVEQ